MSNVERRAAARKTKLDRDQFAMARDQFQIKLIQAKLSGTELAIGMLLSLHFSRELFALDEGLVAWPCIDTLAKLSGLPHRTVRKAIRELQRRGLVRIVEGGGKQRGNQGRSNRYIAIPCPNGSPYPVQMDIRPLSRPLSRGVGEEVRLEREEAFNEFDELYARKPNGRLQ
jgi:hypothetical protein